MSKNIFLFNSIDSVETDEQEILATSLDFDETIEPTISKPCSSSSIKI